MNTISFVIPLYNEEKRVGKLFKALKSVKIPRGLKLEKVIFVNDGSTDATLSKIKRFAKNNKFQCSIISYKENKGKGNAIRLGMLESKSSYTLFFDADISTPLSELEKFMPVIKSGIDVVVGTRKNGKSTVILHQPKYRELLGKVFTFMTKKSLNLDITDFTCGFKAFSYISKEHVFRNAKISGWGYDAEILYLSNKYGYSMHEVPVIWANDDRTKVVLYKAIPQSIKELCQISLEHRLKPVISNALSYFRVKLEYRKTTS